MDFFRQPELVRLHSISDALIALACYSILITLIYATRKRTPMRWRGLIAMFAALLLAFGTTHVLSIWNLSYSMYRLTGLVKAASAVLSVATAIATVRVAPLALARDITDRKRIADELAKGNAELRAREREMRNYLEAAAQAIVAVGEHGQIVLVNRRAEEMFGYRREELLGEPLGMLLPERFRETHAMHRERFFTERHMRPMGAGLELFGLRKDGAEFPVEIGLSFVETARGGLALGMITDITERKRSVDELAQVNEQLRRSNIELEQFAYIASHDLQEPLRMVTSYLNLLEMRYGDKLDAEAAEFIRYAVESAERMKRLIRDVLRFSRAGTRAVTLGEVSAELVVREAIENLHASIEERGARIELAPLPRVTADPSMLTHVFQNLIGNAIKFTKDVQPEVRIAAERRHGEWVFSVRDNGIGIEPRHLDRVFVIFERLNPTEDYPGTGVGLAICKKIVERHHGRIWVESMPGQGSTFYFSIPAGAENIPPEKSVATAM